MIWILMGFIAILAGIVVLILGSMWGLFLLLGGVAIMGLNYTTMMRGKGMDPDQGTVNGLNGKGRQQSEAVTVSQPVIGEQPANIWAQMEQEKK